MTTVCEEEAPAVAAKMEQAHSEWLERNPAIAQEALHALYFGLDAKAKLVAYQALRQRLEKELRQEVEAPPETLHGKMQRVLQSPRCRSTGLPLVMRTGVPDPLYGS
jgi:hypothetical protein